MDKNLELALTTSIKKAETGEIFIEPVCRLFEISYRNQQRVISKDPICQSDSTKKYDELLFGDKRPRLCVGKKGFIRWVQIINAQLVRKDLQKLFIKYQVAVFDYLYMSAESKTIQLEDLKKFNENINKALNIKYQLKAYINEQNKFKNLCLKTEPTEWMVMRTELRQFNSFPLIESERIIADNTYSTLTPDELVSRRKQLKNNINKVAHMLEYQSRKIQSEKNPMPAGYKREIYRLKIKEWESEIVEIERKLLLLSK